MDETTWVQPRIEVLRPAQMAQIHARAKQVLAATGVRVDAARARKVLVGAGATGEPESDIVRLPPALVDWALDAAPAHVDVYDRRGSHAFRLGQDGARFGIGVTTLYYQDPADDRLTPFCRAHMRSIVRLGEALPGFDVVSTVGVPQDVGPDVSDLCAALDTVANTTKPVVLLISDEARFGSPPASASRPPTASRISRSACWRARSPSSPERSRRPTRRSARRTSRRHRSSRIEVRRPHFAR